MDLDEGEPPIGVRVLFAGENEFHTFDVDTDEPEPEHEDELDEGQLRNLVVDLDMSAEADHVVQCCAHELSDEGSRFLTRVELDKAGGARDPRAGSCRR